MRPRDFIQWEALAEGERKTLLRFLTETAEKKGGPSGVLLWDLPNGMQVDALYRETSICLRLAQKGKAREATWIEATREHWRR